MGRIWARVTLHGKSAHGGAPDTGINAIEKMMLLHDRLRSLTARRHELHGSDTLNLGTIRGGTRVNVVADECTAEFDYRFGGLSGEEAEDSMRRAVEHPDLPLVRFEIFERRDSTGISPDLPEVALIRQAIEAATGRRPRFLGTLSAGDAYYTLQRGIPSVWVGPGKTELLHAVNEHVAIEELAAAGRVYAAITLSYAGV
jgi:acetylornithine deacetylase/succinyl-diaminopimelate desuccinylase-like protein